MDRLQPISLAITERVSCPPSSRPVSFGWEKTQEARFVACSAWAALNGWKRGRGFTVDALVRNMPHGGKGFPGWLHGEEIDFFDHADWFRLPTNPYRAVAICAHLYDSADKARAWAASRGLTMHMPPVPNASWYFPGACTMVCYTRPETTVLWLPEQSDTRWAALPAAG